MMEVKQVSESLTLDEKKVINILKKPTTLTKLSKSMNKTKAMRVLQWLENKGIVQTKKINEQLVELGKNGIIYKKKAFQKQDS